MKLPLKISLTFIFEILKNHYTCINGGSMGGKGGRKWRFMAATVCHILYLFGQENFIFIREKSENFFGKRMSVATVTLIKG